ncbi:hypothetical protein M3649_01650 [Ureibacillus chungkukjangi]|uniref:hypothetical protein n=1 Tax=Ureibacillus chungkukjangi TaxID=1202712 RepID=UPI00203E899E|nr:hypothetical protein [Ureibacillus chungkukjangi]MCM3386832.1 hypothetical protein [Ureibacillus chungkukjangi]
MEKKRKRKIRKKKKKWLLYVSLVIVLLAVLGGGYALYEFKFKSYDIADEKVDELIEDNYVIELPDGNEITVDKDGHILEEVSGELVSNSDATSQNPNTSSSSNSGNASTATQNNSNSSNDQASTEKGSSPNPSAPAATEKPTVKSIKAKYTPSLEALEAQANSRINGLIANAKAEYSTKKANGESISIGYFYNKYMAAANGLEASTDATFNTIVGIIEKDLVSNGFDKSHAQSFRTEYEAMKQARRDNILSQVKGAL